MTMKTLLAIAAAIAAPTIAYAASIALPGVVFTTPSSGQLDLDRLHPDRREQSGGAGCGRRADLRLHGAAVVLDRHRHALGRSAVHPDRTGRQQGHRRAVGRGDHGRYLAARHADGIAVMGRAAAGWLLASVWSVAAFAATTTLDGVDVHRQRRDRRQHHATWRDLHRPGTTPPPSGDLLPADRDASENWKKAGLLSIGGIPTRNTVCATLSPKGNKQDDTGAINAAINACPGRAGAATQCRHLHHQRRPDGAAEQGHHAARCGCYHDPADPDQWCHGRLVLPGFGAVGDALRRQ